MSKPSLNLLRLKLIKNQVNKLKYIKLFNFYVQHKKT